MTLNKDLFGNDVPEKPADTPVSVRPRKQWYGKETVFHGSDEPTEEFMRAPLLHVGSAHQAATIVNPNWAEKWDRTEDVPLYDSPEDVPGVTELQFSKHAKVHPITFPDEIANEAHAHFIKDMGLQPTGNISASRSYYGREHPLVSRALNALKTNQIVRYNNTFETPTNFDYNTESDSIQDAYSYIVPSPSLNLVQFGQKDPQTQRMLPMDYTPAMPESEKTKKERKETADLRKWMGEDA